MTNNPQFGNYPILWKLQSKVAACIQNFVNSLMYPTFEFQTSSHEEVPDRVGVCVHACPDRPIY